MSDLLAAAMAQAFLAVLVLGALVGAVVVALVWWLA